MGVTGVSARRQLYGPTPSMVRSLVVRQGARGVAGVPHLEQPTPATKTTGSSVNVAVQPSLEHERQVA